MWPQCSKTVEDHSGGQDTDRHLSPLDEDGEIKKFIVSAGVANGGVTLVIYCSLPIQEHFTE